MVLTQEGKEFIDNWALLFADNEFENITEETFRTFASGVAQLREKGQYRTVQLAGPGFTAQAILGSEAIEPWILYAIKGTPDPTDPTGLAGTWNRSGKEETVYVPGLLPKVFASTGWLLGPGNTATLVEVDIAAGTWHVLKSPRQAALLSTAALEVYGVVTTYAIPASYLNTALTIGIGYDLTVTLPPLTAATVPSLLRLECAVLHGVGYQLTVPGVSRPLSNGEAVLLAAVATPAQPPQTGFPGAPAGTAWRVLSEPSSDLDTSLLGGSYQIQPADLPAPAITVANAALFAAVRLQRLSTGGLVRLSYGTHYTMAGNVLTVLAATNVQPGDLLHYSYVPGASRASYTDAQARAAPLNRTPAAGTTTVTLTAEAATDYGTAASGTFTVDATGCAVGKVVCFTVGAGATAPLFTNAPTGQAYKFVPSNIYASGKAFNYSILVRSDRIEVVIFED